MSDSPVRSSRMQMALVGGISMTVLAGSVSTFLPVVSDRTGLPRFSIYKESQCRKVLSYSVIRLC